MLDTPNDLPHRPLSPRRRSCVTDDIRRTSCDVRPNRSFRGFTLIELLVVISIIALLVGILLPALGSARAMGYATNSLANMRSWGQGTHAFLNDSKYILPWEGEQHSIVLNYPDKAWWGNAIPPYVGQPTYAKLWVTATTAGMPVPQPPEKNIFIDPWAEIGQEQLGPYTYATLPYYFSYVWNASLADNTNTIKIDEHKRVRFDDIRTPTQTILMFELRSAADELAFLVEGDPGYYEKFEDDQLRMKGDYKHLAGRHFQGGHMVYGDGHADRQKFIDAYGGPGWKSE